MEEEAEKLKELQNEVVKQMNLSPPPGVCFCDEEASSSSPSVHISHPFTDKSEADTESFIAK